MALPIGTDLPELTGATEWLNGEVQKSNLVGLPTLVYFWSASCSVCKNNLPILQKWKQAYASRGLKVVAVHLPRAEAERDVARVRAALVEYGMDEPCAVDNEYVLGERFETGGLWPYYFVFDVDGNMKARTAGCAGLMVVETALKKLMDKET